MMVQTPSLTRQEQDALWQTSFMAAAARSYRDLELMRLDRGVAVDHTTIFRWIQAYAANWGIR
jgi:transposase-like protein